MDLFPPTPRSHLFVREVAVLLGVQTDEVEHYTCANPLLPVFHPHFTVFRLKDVVAFQDRALAHYFAPKETPS